MANHDELIKKLFWDFENNKTNSNYRKFNQKIRFDKYNYIVKYLNNRYNDSLSVLESIYRIVFNIEIRPKCQICGNDVVFVGKPNSRGIFKTYCSNSCANKANVNKANKTKLLKYGSVNNIQRSKLTKLEKYGNENYNGDRQLAVQKTDYAARNEKSKRTKLERYCDEKYNGDRIKAVSKCNYAEIQQKMQKTCLERYGDAFYHGDRQLAMQSIDWDKAIKAVKATKFERYGDENYNNMEKNRQTCIKKYGCEYAITSDIVKEKIIKTCLERYDSTYYMLSDDFINKTKESCLSKYNNSIYINSDDFKQKKQNTLLLKYSVINPFQIPGIIDKINETKRKNGTFNTSKPEDECYKLLKEKYPDVIRQYKDERYPFNCDFYILSNDLFIECNFHWTHGEHSYNIETDYEKVNNWKEKNTKFYDNAIETWTIRDPNKRNIAKQNNLNYLEFFNMDDFITWYEQS